MQADEVVLTPPKLGSYNCSGKPHPRDAPRQEVQDGWQSVIIGGEVHRVPRMVSIKTKWADVPCGHTVRKGDPRCKDCPWHLS